MFKSTIPVLLLLMFLIMPAAIRSQERMKAAGIIAKHLDSIGPREKRSGVKNMVANGQIEFTVIRSPVFNKGVTASGQMISISEGNKLYWGAKFDSGDYPFDEVVFDGSRLNTAFIQPGKHSMLGYFLESNNIVREGLFGGPMTSAWYSSEWRGRMDQVDGKGTKKIDGRETYAVGLAGTGHLAVRLYFDAETFRLVRSEYIRSVPPPLTTDPRASISQRETIHKFTEQFGDYKDAGGVVLPHSYQANLLIDGNTTNELQWKVKVASYEFNKKIDPKSFETTY